MRNIQEFITFSSKIEHDLEHDLEHKKLFSNPKIYSAKENLSKRWYVYFSFRNPTTGKLERMQNIYGTANFYKKKEERLEVLTSYRKNLLILLKKGYNPFQDNEKLYQELNSIKKEKVTANASIEKPLEEKSKKATPIAPKADEIPQPSIKEIPKEKVVDNDSLLIKDAFEFALNLKSKEVSKGTIYDYTRKSIHFTKWLAATNPDVKYITEISRKNIITYLNSILLKTSARNYNNYRVDLSSLFQVLKNNEHVKENFIKGIPTLKTKPEKHKRFTEEKQTEIFNYLEKEDEILFLFIKFISYSLIRPVEICRLKIKDIDLNSKTMQFKAKNSPLKTKRIPEILFKDLPDISKFDKESYLFTPTRFGNFWEATDTNRRDHFSKRFKKVVKDHFKLEEEFTIYSFRHTFIFILYNSLRKTKSPFEAKSELMLITGHKSMASLEKYLRNIDAELPGDYSKLFETNGQ
ncbi:tyrosine-type recombinase/integrase [Tenacibaculum sp. 1_MG-2023]|uniref:tyrosine-type recombinase/integrase n=1 Tax=Tenacibaculum sp. 1_MG-2023 TaxID=3062653 RepID=UPI0026E1EC39|nr:tyrosine-type recombinase/integrase [Tenacibaculum sp. 1_MG-2023]MDO6600654.1 tyrosine-type recombinase/integrase [Tenacibaculum sp. 1_MG-2023]